MLNTEALDHRRWKYSGRKGPPENLLKLLIQATNAKRLEVELTGFEELVGGLCSLVGDFDAAVVSRVPHKGRIWQQQGACCAYLKRTNRVQVV